MNNVTWPEFESAAQGQGYTECLKKVWDAGLTLDTHQHPFDVMARVVEGEMWLSHGGQTHHLQAGDDFRLAADVPHQERYGDTAVTVWIARRHPA
jgi:mannose-6-phosphate isomerase-like protein (cupin superfamily)